MTQTLRTNFLAAWTTLKTKIHSLKPFSENKELISEALQFHLHQASSLTSENSSEPLLAQHGLKQEKERLTQHLEELTRKSEDHPMDERAKQYFESEKERINNRLLAIDHSLRDNSTAQAFAEQKRKNEQIVKECQQLLAQLK